MTTPHIEQQADTAQAGVIRAGGLAMIIGLAIHFFVNGVLKEFPPEDPSLDELRAYLSAEAGTWATVHGARAVAFVCIALFSAGLYARTSPLRGSSLNCWGIVGLLGSTMLLANAMITNGIETLAFLDFERLSEQPALFWLLFHVTRTLWTAEIVAWGIIIGGFSIAGLHSGTLPKWLAWFGVLSALACVLSSVCVVSILHDGWAVPLIDVGALTGLAWFFCVSGVMVVKGAVR